MQLSHTGVQAEVQFAASKAADAAAQKSEFRKETYE
jgi:hypothetical protein